MSVRLAAIDVRGARGEALAVAALAEVSPAERARAQRYRRPEDRVRTLSAQWLARRVVAAAIGVPDAVNLERDEYGRLQAPGSADVSVAHTGPWVVAAATASGAIGVDVENAARFADLDVTGFVSEAERAAVLEAQDRGRAAAEHWTLKEAIVKLRGTGFLIDPREVVFDRDRLRADEVQLRLYPGPDVDHLMALAVHTVGRPLSDPPLERWDRFEVLT